MSIILLVVAVWMLVLITTDDDLGSELRDDKALSISLITMASASVIYHSIIIFWLGGCPSKIERFSAGYALTVSGYT